MKKFFNKVQNKANELAIRAKSTIDNARAEGYIDTGVKIIIGVVVGAVILGGLYALFTLTIPPLTSRALPSPATLPSFLTLTTAAKRPR